MKVKDIFDLGIRMAIFADQRGVAAVKQYLEGKRREYEDLKPSEKKYYDAQKLENPYLDSFIHVDDTKTDVKRVLVGIDITTSDILLASQLDERGKKIDLVIAHHPVGRGLVYLSDVMEMTAEMYASSGIPIHLAEKIVEERMKEVGRSVFPINHYQVVDAAKIIGKNFINTHTITDNLVQKFIADYLAKRKPMVLGDIVDMLLEIPEYQYAKQNGFGPSIFAGNPKHKVGKYIVEMTGGTEPSVNVYQQLSQCGISTIVGMHMKSEPLEKANENHLNVIIAGHMSSDSLGVNLFLDELEKKGIEIVPCGGFIRVSRNKKK